MFTEQKKTQLTKKDALKLKIHKQYKSCDKNTSECEVKDNVLN